MPTAIVARFVLLEARRGGLPWLATASLAVALFLAGFASQVALTESLALQTAMLGAVLRACAVFLVAAQVASSTLREINDKGMEVMLSLPVSRSTHYLGRLAGFVCAGALLALLFSIALLPWTGLGATMLWGLSLAFELALVAAAALFFSVTLTQLVPAIAATGGLYLLSRTITTIQTLASSPLAGDSPAQRVTAWIVDGLALLLPRLDAVTRTEWLLYHAPSAAGYAAALASLLLYTLLLVAAGLFDFHRRSF